MHPHRPPGPGFHPGGPRPGHPPPGPFMRPPPPGPHGPMGSSGPGPGFGPGPGPSPQGPPMHRPDFGNHPPPFPPPQGGPPPPWNSGGPRPPHWNADAPRPPPQQGSFNQRPPHPPPYQGAPPHQPPMHPPNGPPPFGGPRCPPPNRPGDPQMMGPPPRDPRMMGPPPSDSRMMGPPPGDPRIMGPPPGDQRMMGPPPGDMRMRAPPPLQQGPPGNFQPPPNVQGGPGSDHGFPLPPAGPMNRYDENPHLGHHPSQKDAPQFEDERGPFYKLSFDSCRQSRSREPERKDDSTHERRTNHEENQRPRDPDRFQSRERTDGDYDDQGQYNQNRNWEHDRTRSDKEYRDHSNSRREPRTDERIDSSSQSRHDEYKDYDRDDPRRYDSREAGDSRSHSYDRTGTSRESQMRRGRSPSPRPDQSRDRDREMRDRDRNRDSGRDRDRTRDGDRERNRDRVRDTDRGMDRERNNDRGGDRESDRERGREKDRTRDRGMSRSNGRERDRTDTGSDRDRVRDRDRGRDRERETDRSRDRSPLRQNRKEPAERSSGRDERSMSLSRSDREARDQSRDSSRRGSVSQRPPEGPQREEGRSRTPPREERRNRSPDGRESSVANDDNRKSRGHASDPSKPRERWNELERKLREEEEAERRDLDLSPDLFDEDQDQDDSAVDDQPWVQCSPRENFLTIAPSDKINGSSVCASEKLKDLLGRFESDIVERGPRIRVTQPKPEQKKPELHYHVHHEHSDSESGSGSDSESDSDASSEEEDKEYDHRITCLENRANHPWRLADNLWFNEPGEMNDGPLCKCSLKQQKTGIRHNIYPGETAIPPCEPHTNNASRLHHYRVTISPTVNFLTPTQTVIVYDKREYIFEGFSVFSHHSLDEVPECKVVRFGKEYTLHFFSEPMPEHFTVKGLDLFAKFLFEEILELWDFDFKGKEGGCQYFHFMPRFARLLPNNGKEVLSMHHVIQYLMRSSKPIIDSTKLNDWLAVSEPTWQKYVDRLRHMIATRPGKKPSSIRIDQVDRDQREPDKVTFPVIVHFGVRPAQLSYIRDPNYRKLLKSFTRLRHLLLNKPRVTNADKVKLAEKEANLQKMRVQNSRTREVTAVVSCEDMLATGVGMDICQHALMLPVLVSHLRYFACLTSMYKVLDYKFQDPMLLRYAMTHPSYKLYYGTNPDHVRNALYNCGIRFKQDFSESKKMLAKERKKGINQLYRIMSLMASDDEIPSHVKNYERLEFLGDAVIEFLSSTHLYHLFPDLEEGGLASYRVALVQNQHLSVLAKKLELEKYMLYAHGPDLCRPYDLRHAMANCLEAVMGALYLEAGLEHVRKFFGKLLFEENRFLGIWLGHPKDPLQLDFPKTDRHLIENSPILQKLTTFEEATGIRFRHIRLLARAFTQRTVGYTHLTRGSNQRLEFLGDSVLQLVVSTYLYKHFPDHHEGHLSLLRSSLVNNKIQSIVAQDLGLTEYIIDTKTRSHNDNNVPMKIMADLVEALIGAMYVDRGLDIVETFCGVVFFPRLKDFIMTQDWNDAKSQLQQCCLTLRVEGQEPDVPTYKVISQSGPTNSRQYLVAVYFRSKRMATGAASNIQDAQMEAAKNALRRGNFPHLWFQRNCVMLRKQREMEMKTSGGGGGRDGRRDGRDDRRNRRDDRRERRDDDRRSGRDDERRRRERRDDRGREGDDRKNEREQKNREDEQETKKGNERWKDEGQVVTSDMRGLLFSNRDNEDKGKEGGNEGGKDESGKDDEGKNDRQKVESSKNKEEAEKKPVELPNSEEQKPSGKLDSEEPTEQTEPKSDKDTRQQRVSSDGGTEREERSTERSGEHRKQDTSRDRGRYDRGRSDSRYDSRNDSRNAPDRGQRREDRRDSSSQRRDRGRSPERRSDGRSSWKNDRDRQSRDRRDGQSGDRSSRDRQGRGESKREEQTCQPSRISRDSPDFLSL